MQGQSRTYEGINEQNLILASGTNFLNYDNFRSALFLIFFHGEVKLGVSLGKIPLTSFSLIWIAQELSNMLYHLFFKSQASVFRIMYA